MLIFVGLGLFDETDMSLKAYNVIKNANMVFAEFYTSTLQGTTIEKLERFLGKDIIVLSREEVENGDRIITAAKNNVVAFITAGAPMIATTHVALRLRAVTEQIPVHIVHGVSIQCAVPELLGLQSYKFGKVVTIPFSDLYHLPESVYESIEKNQNLGLHTLVLLDIAKDRFMTANEAIAILLAMERKFQRSVITEHTYIAVVARAGSEHPVLSAGTIKTLANAEFGPPMHTLVILGKLHFMEKEALIAFAKLKKD